MIRNATIEDSPELARIGRRYSRDTLLGDLTDEQVNSIIKSCLDNGIAVVADNEGKIVGVLAGTFVEGFSMGKFFEEAIWYVEPEHRGIGKEIYDTAEQLCRDNDCKGMTMAAYNNKYLNIVDRFYKSNGFEEVDRRYYKKL